MIDVFRGDINGLDVFDSDLAEDEESGYISNKPIIALKILRSEVIRETEKAFLFKFNDSENWMPKSQVKLNKKKDSVEIPNWLWEKMSVCSDL